VGNPLDPQTAALYGQFVQCAYKMYAATGQPDPLRPAPIDIPEGYELGAWINMSDFLLTVETVKFYGIVCHRLDDENTRIIAIRGTEGSLEWVDDAAAVLVPFKPVPGNGRVAYGFDKIYSTMQVIPCPLPGEAVLEQVSSGAEAKPAAVPAPEPELAGTFAEQLDHLAARREAWRRNQQEKQASTTAIEAAEALVVSPARPSRPTIVVGHSLGSALATLFVMENDSKKLFEVSGLCTFASPRVGDLEFVSHFNNLGLDSWRIVNTRDLVPKLPFSIPLVLPYAQVDTEYSFDSEVFARKSLGCYHEMTTYLHWLDQTVAISTECAL
jgi:hypothetical protein